MLRRWRLEAHRDSGRGGAPADRRLEFFECEPAEAEFHDCDLISEFGDQTLDEGTPQSAGEGVDIPVDSAEESGSERRFDITVDSGAGKSLMLPEAAPEYQLRASPGQSEGQHVVG